MKAKPVLLTAIIPLLTMSACSFGQYNSPFTNFDRAFIAINKIITNDVENGFSAAQIAVMQNGKLMLQHSWGSLNTYNKDGTKVEELTPVTNDTMFDLEENTMMYSAQFALQYLVEQKLLDIDKPIHELLGDTGFYEKTIHIEFSEESQQTYPLETVIEWKKNITLRDVLCHRAGFLSNPPYMKTKYDFKTDTAKTEIDNPLFSGYDHTQDTRKLTYETLCKTPLVYQPKTKIKYSDADYMVVDFVIEKITGKSLEKYLKDTLYQYLSLKHITFNPLENGFTPADCAATELNGNTHDATVSYEGIRTDTLQGLAHSELSWHTMAGMSGQGGLFSTATDLAKLAYTMVTGKMGSKVIFSEETMNTFVTPETYEDETLKQEAQKWGIGWWRQGNSQRTDCFSKLAPSNAIGYQGSTGTFTLIDREHNLVIVYLTNKINSPVTDKATNNNIFNGDWYTSGILNFVPQIIYNATLTEDKKEARNKMIETLDELVALRKKEKDAIKDIKETHPASLAYKAISKAATEFKSID